MAMDRWDPYREMISMRDALDRFMQEGVFRPASALWQTARGSFPIDVQETPEGYVLRASLPGVKPDDVHINVEGNVLTIRAERKAAPEEASQGQWLLREHRDETFLRSVTLPATINVSAAQARYEHGILLLQLPKAEVVPPQRIPITGVAPRRQQAAQTSAAPPAQPPHRGHSGQPLEDIKAASDIRGKPSIDEVMEASEDSFPASDPPSYTQTAPSPSPQSGV